MKYFQHHLYPIFYKDLLKVSRKYDLSVLGDKDSLYFLLKNFPDNFPFGKVRSVFDKGPKHFYINNVIAIDIFVLDYKIRLDAELEKPRSFSMAKGAKEYKVSGNEIKDYFENTLITWKGIMKRFLL